MNCQDKIELIEVQALFLRDLLLSDEYDAELANNTIVRILDLCKE